MVLPTTKHQGRIPVALQAVFLASNRGKDVHKPPPDQAGSKVFFCNWFLQRKSNSKRKMMKKENSSRGKGVAFDLKAFQKQSHQPKQQQQQQQQKQHQYKSLKSISPQAFLDVLLSSRGYSTRRYTSLRTSYYNKPTSLQQASYDGYLIGLIRGNKVKTFKEVMSCGLSPNPCNNYGESIVHIVCRHVNHEMLEILVNNGSCLQVSDDYRRTPLHDACWAAKPSFETVEMLLNVDSRLFHMIDSRGHVPLSYVREDHWGEWIDFFESNADIYWPITKQRQGRPLLTRAKADTRPLPDPMNALPIELAKMVASGRMKPHEAIFLSTDDKDDDDDDATRLTHDDDSSFFSSSDEDSDCDSYLSEDEMEVLLTGLPALP